MTTTSQITLAATPTGPVGATNFGEQVVPLPPLADGEFLVAVRWLSIDPTIRGWMAYDTYLPKIAEGEVIRSLGAGEVIESRNDKFPVGARVTGVTGWQTHAIMSGAFRIPDGVDYEDALSVFGMTGLTAFVGIEDIGQPMAGETVVVSGAAGAVGSLAGQFISAASASATSSAISWSQSGKSDSTTILSSLNEALGSGAGASSGSG